jgi:hypothetical protein
VFILNNIISILFRIIYIKAYFYILGLSSHNINTQSSQANTYFYIKAYLYILGLSSQANT